MGSTDPAAEIPTEHQHAATRAEMFKRMRMLLELIRNSRVQAASG